MKFYYGANYRNEKANLVQFHFFVLFLRIEITVELKNYLIKDLLILKNMPILILSK